MVENASTPPEEYKDRVAQGKNWAEIVAWVGDLPPLPHVASKALALVEDPDTTAGELSDLLSSDTALAARVLKIANSAMFSRQREITTLNQAIMVIGFKALKGIVVAATLRQLNRKSGKIEKLVWENSMCTAISSHVITQHLRKPYQDELFLLGLLHDLGKLVLIRETSSDYQVVMTEVKQGKSFAEAEQDTLGFAHPLIGALVAKKWNFSPETCQVILHHHDPLDLPLEGELDEKTAIVQLGNIFAHRLGYGHFDGYEIDEELQSELAEALGIEEKEQLDELVEKAEATFQEQGSVFG